MRRTAHARRAGGPLIRRLAAVAALVAAVVAVVSALSGPPGPSGGTAGVVAVASMSTSPGSPRRRGATGGTDRAAGASRRGHGAGAATPAAFPQARPTAPAGPAQARLTTALARQLALSGPRSGALVVNLRTGATLFSLRAAVGRAPASVEKLWTTVAALRMLGPRARLQTSLLGTGFERDGVWHGNLYLRGGGDPTFSDTAFDRAWFGGLGPTATEMADQIIARGIHGATGRLYADESLFDRRRGGLLTGQLADVPDLGGQLSALVYDHGAAPRGYNPATFAAHELALTLRAAGVRVLAASRDAVTPPRARPLATVSSPTLTALIRLMNVPSDDLFAEMLAKQLGVRFGAGGTIAAGARVIGRTIAADYGLRPLILDGSGLSPSDRSSPLEVVGLLRQVWQTPIGRELQASLPVVGRQGTVQGIAVGTAAAGNCVAKTGTLDYVTNMAGYCTARGHQPLAFAVFVDGPTNSAAIALEGAMVAAIARY